MNASEKRMGKASYVQRLRDPRWQRKRLEIMNRDDFRCRLCGESEATLNVHHLWYRREADPWDYPDTALVTTCGGCHEELHVFPVGGYLVEALIVGGASMVNMMGVLAAFESSLSDGPYAQRMTTEQWAVFEGALKYALMSAQAGATESQVREALAPLFRGVA